MEITVVIGRFEDLAARGLRSLLAEQANIQVVAADVELDAFDAALTEHEPQVAIVNDIGKPRLAVPGSCQPWRTEARTRNEFPSAAEGSGKAAAVPICPAASPARCHSRS